MKADLYRRDTWYVRSRHHSHRRMRLTIPAMISFFPDDQFRGLRVSCSQSESAAAKCSDTYSSEYSMSFLAFGETEQDTHRFCLVLRDRVLALASAHGEHWLSASGLRHHASGEESLAGTGRERSNGRPGFVYFFYTVILQSSHY